MPNGVVIVVAGDDKTGVVFDAVKRHLAETKDKARETSESLGQIGNVLRSGLQAAGISIGIREIVGQFDKLITSSMEMGVELGHVSKQTGISVQNLSVLRYASQATGIEFETLTKGFKKLSTGIYEWEHGSKQAASTFAALGISEENLKQTGGDMYRVLEMVADRFAGMPDGITKNALATQLFGRAGQDLIPVLDEGAAGIESFRSEAESLGLVLDKNGVEKMEELHRSITAMKGAWAGLGLEITSTLSPALEQLANNTTKWIETLKDNPMKGFAQFMGLGQFWHDTPEDIQHKRLTDILHQSAQPLLAKPEGTKPEFTPGKPENTDAAQNRLEESRMQLADAAAKADAAREKSSADTQIAILESLHKQQLISDAAYFDQKAALQRSAFAAEHDAIQAQQIALMDRIDAVEAKKPKTGKERLEQAAQLNTLRAQELDLDAKLLALDGQRAAKAAEDEAARAEALQRRAEQIAAMEAELERAGGKGVSKQIDEARLKSGDERAGMVTNGATPQQLAEFDALEKLKEAKLQVQDLDRQGEVIRRQAELAEAKVQQEELSHALSQQDAAKALDAIRAQELVKLAALARAYQQYGDAGEDAEARIEQQITQVMQQMQKQGQELNQAMQQIAHSIFDPLFEMGEKWHKQWQQITKNLERDASQFAEKQLFGLLFGDQATGGHGQRAGVLSPGAGNRSGVGGVGGVLSGLLGTLFGHKQAGPTSNGGLGGGAGTVPSAAASLMQLGKGVASGSGGIQVVLNNQGPAMQVDQSSQSQGDGGEGQVIQIMLKQLDSNGPVSQAIMGLFNH
jgi:hypothetical protein